MFKAKITSMTMQMCQRIFIVSLPTKTSFKSAAFQNAHHWKAQFDIFSAGFFSKLKKKISSIWIPKLQVWSRWEFFVCQYLSVTSGPGKFLGSGQLFASTWYSRQYKILFCTFQDEIIIFGYCSKWLSVEAYNLQWVNEWLYWWFYYETRLIFFAQVHENQSWNNIFDAETE